MSERTDSELGKDKEILKKERGQARRKFLTRLISDILLLASAMLLIEIVGVVYLIYSLGLYHDSRWTHLVMVNSIAAVPVIGIMIFSCVKWAQPAIRFDRMLLGRKAVTTLDCEHYINTTFLWARNGALLLVFLYMVVTLLSLWVYLRYSWLTGEQVLFLFLFKCFSSLNMGIIFFYAVKIIVASSRRSFGVAVEKLFTSGVYEWRHFRLKIRYKMFLVIFTVVAYLLCSAVIMGFTQTETTARSQLKQNLENWLKIIQKQTAAANTTSDQASRASELTSFLLENQLIANANVILLDSNGSLVQGKAGQLEPKEVQTIVSSKSAGELVNYAENRLVIYNPGPGPNQIAVALGHWGSLAGVLKQTRNPIVALLLATILLTSIATYLLVRDINAPLTEVLGFLRAISSGGSAPHLRAYSEDELGDFSREMARATALLQSRTSRANELLKRIQGISTAVRENSAGVQTASAEQADGVSELAAAITQVGATSNELVATSKKIAEAANNVQTQAGQSLLSCQSGTGRVEDALKSFGALSDYVGQISRSVVDLAEGIKKITIIMEIIEEVAKQINLLSINAQLEAAGSGEAGKRFAVVAKEVRRLSEQTSDSVKLIKEVVGSTLEAAQNSADFAQKGMEVLDKGTQMADAVGQTFSEIKAQVESTEKISREIAIITGQQNIAAEQISRAIMDIDATAHQIKANTSNILAAIENLSGTAASLVAELR